MKFRVLLFVMLFASSVCYAAHPRAGGGSGHGGGGVHAFASHGGGRAFHGFASHGGGRAFHGFALHGGGRHAFVGHVGRVAGTHSFHHRVGFSGFGHRGWRHGFSHEGVAGLYNYYAPDYYYDDVDPWDVYPYYPYDEDYLLYYAYPYHYPYDDPFLDLLLAIIHT